MMISPGQVHVMQSREIDFLSVLLSEIARLFLTKGAIKNWCEKDAAQDEGKRIRRGSMT